LKNDENKLREKVKHATKITYTDWTISSKCFIRGRRSSFFLMLVLRAPKSCHITLILRALHWLKITEYIEYKLLSLTYKVITTTKPSYLHYLITIQSHCSTRSSSLVTLAHPPTSPSLRITDCNFWYISSYLLHSCQPNPTSDFSFSASLTSTSSVASPLSSSITHSFFHSHLLHKLFPPIRNLFFFRTKTTVFQLLLILLRFSVFFLIFSFFHHLFILWHMQ